MEGTTPDGPVVFSGSSINLIDTLREGEEKGLDLKV